MSFYLKFPTIEKGLNVQRAVGGIGRFQMGKVGDTVNNLVNIYLQFVRY